MTRSHRMLGREVESKPPATNAPTQRALASTPAHAPPALARGTRNDLHTGPDPHVAAIAHDVRTPLSIILLEAGLLEQRLGARSTTAVQRSLERIALNASYIDRLISGLLDLASASAGRLELSLSTVDLAGLLSATLQRAVSSWDRARVRLEIRDVVYVSADAGRLERVIANLVCNALKYSAAQGPVTVRLDLRGSNACVSVIDTGPGLTPEQIGAVFGEYERLAAEVGRDGYGLGLFLCKQIIEAHHGTIGVQSTPGRGSRFHFELPILPHASPIAH